MPSETPQEVICPVARKGCFTISCPHYRKHIHNGMCDNSVHISVTSVCKPCVPVEKKMPNETPNALVCVTCGGVRRASDWGFVCSSCRDEREKPNTASETPRRVWGNEVEANNAVRVK